VYFFRHLSSVYWYHAGSLEHMSSRYAPYITRKQPFCFNKEPELIINHEQLSNCYTYWNHGTAIVQRQAQGYAVALRPGDVT
jgi:hypothetical protein